MALQTTFQVVMPQMGDSVTEGTILEWHKQEGDQVAAGETLVEISTDKVDAEVPSPQAGTLVKIHAAEGDSVTVGSLLAELSSEGGEGEQPSARLLWAAKTAPPLHLWSTSSRPRRESPSRRGRSSNGR